MQELSPVQFEIKTIVEWDEWKHKCLPRMRYAKKLRIPHLPQLEPHTGKCAIVGSGPSVVDYVNEIAAIRQDEFNTVMSVNGVHDWLVKQGVKPRLHVISEPDIDDISQPLGGDPQNGVAYYICSHCDQVIFKQLEGYHRVLWHCFCPVQRYQQAIAKWFPGEFMVAGGWATFFKSMNIALVLGFRDFELFGIDSSFQDSSHMDGYTIANREKRVNIWGRDPRSEELKRFTTQGGLAFQAREFIEFCRHNQPGLRLRIHGDGLLRYLHESRHPEQYHNMKGN